MRSAALGDPQLVVIYVNDLHGQLRADLKNGGGYARLAAFIKGERDRAGTGADVLVIAGGNVAEKGALPCRKTNDNACFPLLKDVGVDVAVLGTSEIKRSAADLNHLIDLSEIFFHHGRSEEEADYRSDEKSTLSQS